VALGCTESCHNVVETDVVFLRADADNLGGKRTGRHGGPIYVLAAGLHAAAEVRGERDRRADKAAALLFGHGWLLYAFIMH
jgi:hypothetical protein